MRVVINIADSTVTVNGGARTVHGLSSLYPNIRRVDYDSASGCLVTFSDGTTTDKDHLGDFQDALNAFNLLLPLGEGYSASKVNGVWSAAAISPTAQQNALDKQVVLSTARQMREIILNRLTGLQVNSTSASDIAAIQACRASLLALPDSATVIAATDGPSTRAAVLAAWLAIEQAFVAAAPTLAAAFGNMGMSL